MGTGQDEKMQKTTGLCSNCYKRALKGLEMKSLATQSSKRKENKAKLYFENPLPKCTCYTANVLSVEIADVCLQSKSKSKH